MAAVNAGRVNTAATGIVRDNSQADKLNKSAVLTSFAKEKLLVKVTQPIVTQKQLNLWLNHRKNRKIYKIFHLQFS